MGRDAGKYLGVSSHCYRNSGQHWKEAKVDLERQTHRCYERGRSIVSMVTLCVNSHSRSNRGFWLVSPEPTKQDNLIHSVNSGVLCFFNLFVTEVVSSFCFVLVEPTTPIFSCHDSDSVRRCYTLFCCLSSVVGQCDLVFSSRRL